MKSKHRIITGPKLRRVRRLAARGGTIPQMAAELGISPRTFKRYIDEQDTPEAERLSLYVREGRDLSRRPLGLWMLYLKDKWEYLLIAILELEPDEDREEITRIKEELNEISLALNQAAKNDEECSSAYSKDKLGWRRRRR